MDKANKIFLIGLPGCGKTTLAKQVAAQISLPFVDLDKEIERNAGMSVQDIFADKGEPYFRALESQTLNQFCNSASGFVMATGGGAPCFGNNIGTMKNAGMVVFLDVPAKEITDRIAKQTNQRPLLRNETPDSMKDRIEFLRSQRISFYKQAHYTITGIDIKSNEIIDLLTK
jgi:shikimate kinase